MTVFECNIETDHCFTLYLKCTWKYFIIRTLILIWLFNGLEKKTLLLEMIPSKSCTRTSGVVITVHKHFTTVNYNFLLRFVSLSWRSFFNYLFKWSLIIYFLKYNSLTSMALQYDFASRKREQHVKSAWVMHTLSVITCLFNER